MTQRLTFQRRNSTLNLGSVFLEILGHHGLILFYRWIQALRKIGMHLFQRIQTISLLALINTTVFQVSHPLYYLILDRKHQFTLFWLISFQSFEYFVQKSVNVNLVYNYSVILFYYSLRKLVLSILIHNFTLTILLTILALFFISVLSILFGISIRSCERVISMSSRCQSISELS